MTARWDEHDLDEELVAAAADGQRLAFDELVRRHGDTVYRLAVRLLSDRDLAADVTQDTLLRAWRALPTFRGDAAFTTWLHRITVNTAFTARRKASRRTLVDLDSVEHELPSDDSMREFGERLDMRSDLERAFAKLSPAARTVVVMKDVRSLSHAEIAGELGISVTAAKVRLHRARGALQRHLEADRR